MSVTFTVPKKRFKIHFQNTDYYISLTEFYSFFLLCALIIQVLFINCEKKKIHQVLFEAHLKSSQSDYKFKK